MLASRKESDNVQHDNVEFREKVISFWDCYFFNIFKLRPGPRGLRLATPLTIMHIGCVASANYGTCQERVHTHAPSDCSSWCPGADNHYINSTSLMFTNNTTVLSSSAHERYNRYAFRVGHCQGDTPEIPPYQHPTPYNTVSNSYILKNMLPTTYR